MKTKTVSGVRAAVPICNMTAVDAATNITTVYTGPCYFYGVFVTTVLSAHACPIKNGSTTVVTLPASSAVGTYYEFPGAYFDTSLVVDPDDAATGNLTVFWREA